MRHRGPGHLEGSFSFWAPEEREVLKYAFHVKLYLELSIQGPGLLVFWICFIKESKALIPTKLFLLIIFSREHKVKLHFKVQTVLGIPWRSKG